MSLRANGSPVTNIKTLQVKSFCLSTAAVCSLRRRISANGAAVDMKLQLAGVLALFPFDLPKERVGVYEPAEKNKRDQDRHYDH